MRVFTLIDHGGHFIVTMNTVNQSPTLLSTERSNFKIRVLDYFDDTTRLT